MNGKGDHLLALPALRALCALFPGRLTLVCLAGVRRTFFRDLEVRRFVEVSPRHSGPRWQRSFDGGQAARRIGRCDLFVSLNPWHSDAVETLLDTLRPDRSVGFFRGFDQVLQLDYAKHSMDLSFDVVRHLSPLLRLVRFADPPSLSPRAVRVGRAVRRLIPRHGSVLAVHADTRRGKMWPTGRFVRTLDRFLSRHPEYFVLVLGRRRLRLDRGRHGRRVIPCYGLPLDVSIALLSQADLFLGVDSCMLHGADLFRIPGVGLFGPTDPAEFGFRFAPHQHVRGATMEAICEDAVADALERSVKDQLRITR